MFCDALDDLTQNYHCMVIKNRVLSNKIDDVVFWYKARLHKPFKVGKPEWWAWANAHYNPQHDIEEEEKRLAERKQHQANTLYNQPRGRNQVKLKVVLEP
jgi:hypothetical protein